VATLPPDTALLADLPPLRRFRPTLRPSARGGMKASSCSLDGAERLMRPMAGARAAGATGIGCLRGAPRHRWAPPALRPAAQQTRGPTNIATQRRFVQPQPRAEVLCSEVEGVDSRAVTAGGTAEGPAAAWTELWEGVPARTKLTVGCASAFMLSNMVRYHDNYTREWPLSVPRGCSVGGGPSFQRMCITGRPTSHRTHLRTTGCTTCHASNHACWTGAPRRTK